MRIQRLRTKGWRLPANTVCVDRSTRWGNPWRIGLDACGCRAAGECTHNTLRVETAAEAVDAYRDWIDTWPFARRAETLALLRGKNLACWCPPDRPCHADVLLELANA